MGAALAAAEPQADLGLGDRRRRARRRRSSRRRSRRGPRRPAPSPAAWAIRPQLGSRPKSAVLTSGELAIARATRSASASVGGAARPRPGRPGRRPRRRRRSRSPAAAGPRRAGPRAAAAPAAPVACSSTVSLVLIWPSTVIRSKEASTARAQRRVGVVDDGVGLDEAEHRRHVRLDHPGALGLGGEGDAAGPQRAALRPAVGGHDRLGEGAAAGRPRGPRRPRRSRRAPSSIGSGTPIIAGLGDGDLRGLEARAPAAARRTSRARRRSPARRSRRWRCRS